MTAPARSGRRAVIQLTGASNNARAFSHVEGAGAFKGLRELGRTLLALRARGLDAVEFAGGEPTLWPWLPQAAALARKAGFGAVSVVTNGRRLADPAYADALAAAGVNTVIFTIPGHTPALYAAEAGAGPEALGQALAGVRNLARHRGVERGLVLPVRAALAADLENAVRRLSAGGFAFITLAFDAPYDLLAGAPARDLAEKHRLLPGVLALLPRLRKYGRIITEGAQPCLLGRHSGLALNESFRNPGVLVRDGGRSVAELPDAYRLLGAKTAACRGCRWAPDCPGFFAGDAPHVPGALAPYNAALDLQDGCCDYRCGFCARRRDGVRYRDLDPGKFFAKPDPGLLAAFFRSSSAYNENLNIWGRDRTEMFPGIEKIIRQARDCGFRRVTLWTTGLRLADRARLERLRRAGLTGFEIPLYGHDAATHDAATATPGAFAGVMRGLEALKAYGRLRADFHAVVLKRNAAGLPALARLAGGRFPGSRLMLWHYYLDDRNSRESRRAYAANLPSYPELCRAFSGPRRPPQPELMTILFPLCVAARLEGGKLGPASAPRSFALLVCNEKGTFHKSVTSAEFGERHVAACRRCPARRSCAGVMEDYLEVYGPAGIGPAGLR